ncbi:MAG: tRNA (N(6)-L-threonylcarbamoyladenosine(37)-C(2))-methylthiotransferase MtaB [Deltaproteobacteria bacterium]|nr:tRNA (N(6)-L-threonylcarbamoyladenosine(37)-C(2))-methylthiotransferase MtaB [Deltaproteobacteria bacterium]
MKVAITTLGCKVNQYDSAALASELGRDGHSLVPFEAGADVYIVNTCTVTDRADWESRQLLRRVKRWNPSARVVMTGCYVQANPQGVAAVDGVDFAIGLNRRDELVRAVRGEFGPKQAQVLVDNLRQAEGPPLLGAEVFSGRTRAFLKVQDGCDQFCTFCVVPWSRGRSRSVPPRAILAELDKLADCGFQEVVLAGIHLGGYGHDLRPQMGLAELVEMVAERARLARIRLSSVDPPEVSPRLLEIMRRSDRVCPHLHVPVQAGDDAVLQRMRRRYDTRLVRDVLAEVRLQLPDAGIGTDLIAGFPGETELEFERTSALLDSLPFTYFHVFPYSRRAGTTAAKLAGHLPKPVVAARARRLRRLGERKRAAFASSLAGCQLRVLLEAGAAPVSGYSRNYVRVLVPGSGPAPNHEVSVRVTAVRGAVVEGDIA